MIFYAYNEAKFTTAPIRQNKYLDQYFLIEKPKSRLLPIFSPDFTLNSQIWLFILKNRFSSKSLVLCFKGGYYPLPVMPCGQIILSTAEFQCLTHFKVSPRRKRKGTREIHEIIQYTLRKLYRS